MPEPEIDKRNQNRGERRKPAIIFAVIGVVIVGIFLIIIFFFHGDLRSRAPFKAYNDPRSPAGVLTVSRHSPGAQGFCAKARAFGLRQV